MIYECSSNHICFSKNELSICGVKGCNKVTIVISLIDINWFYKINKNGLCINRVDLDKIIKDPNMPQKVKKQIEKLFFNL